VLQARDRSLTSDIGFLIVCSLSLALTDFTACKYDGRRTAEIGERICASGGSNDADALDKLLADDWIIVEPDGGMIDKARFLGVIRSGALSHESMESTDLKIRVYGNTAVVTGLTTSKGKFMGQDFTSCERATDIFVKQSDRWQCVFTQLTRFTKK